MCLKAPNSQTQIKAKNTKNKTHFRTDGYYSPLKFMLLSLYINCQQQKTLIMCIGWNAINLEKELKPFTTATTKIKYSFFISNYKLRKLFKY